MNRKRKFYVPREDRRVLVFLMLCILAVVVVYKCLYPEGARRHDGTEFTSQRLDSFAQTSANRGLGRQYGEDNSVEGERVPETFVFDPNRADSATFVRLGLLPWQASNALKYRRKGGRWRSPDDFARLYGLSEETFRRLRPYIRISPEDAAPRYGDRSVWRTDSVNHRYPEKFLRGTTVDLNTADTNMLRRIPGIGRYYSQAIRRYGERLGGYVSVHQVAEIEGLPEGIEEWFTLDSSVAVRKLYINRATFKQLVRHPYLDYERVKSIFQYRERYGPIKGWEQLLFLPGFLPGDKERLAPYVSFD